MCWQIETDITMVKTKLYKKSSPNGLIVLYLSKREYISVDGDLEHIKGIVNIPNKDKLKGKIVFANLKATFRYGREEDEMMGVAMSKEINVDKTIVYGTGKKDPVETDHLQTLVMQKLGEGAEPFVLKFGSTSPNSVLIHGEPGDTTLMGVHYTVRVWVGDDPGDLEGVPSSSISMAVIKSQISVKDKQVRTPLGQGEKDFSCGGCSSAGKVSMEVSLDREYFHHGETIPIHIVIANQSTKPIKAIRLSIVQHCELVMVGDQFSSKIAKVESTDGCPIEPEATLNKTVTLTPTIQASNLERGMVLDGYLSGNPEDSNWASSTLPEDEKEMNGVGVVISYCVKLYAMFSSMGGEFVIDVPFKLVHPSNRLNEGSNEDESIVKAKKRLQSSHGSVVMQSFMDEE